MARWRVLVFGVSGVGKSVACERFVKENRRFAHLRASALLSDVLGTSPELLRVAPADAIRHNQLHLANIMNSRSAELGDVTILLDGHAVIDNDKTLIRVPVEAVAALRPDGLLLLEASPETVLERRQQQPQRARPERSLSDLATEIKAEREAVWEYHRELGVPLETAMVEPMARLDASMRSLLSRIELDQN